MATARELHAGRAGVGDEIKVIKVRGGGQGGFRCRIILLLRPYCTFAAEIDLAVGGFGGRLLLYYVPLTTTTRWPPPLEYRAPNGNW